MRKSSKRTGRRRTKVKAEKKVYPLSATQLGRLGEAELGRWAAAAAMNIHKVETDEKGWDAILELPRGDSSRGLSGVEHRPTDLTCRVQVKATFSDDRCESVKLSNWERFAKDPYPCFFLVLEYSLQKRVRAAYLVHVDEEWIARTLKRLRKLKPAEEMSLHKKWMNLTWSKQDAIDSLDGEGLLNRIRALVGKDPNRYALQKGKWINSVGYEGERFRMTIRTEAPPEASASWRLMSDFAVGLVDELPITILQVEETRFDIAKPAKLPIAGKPLSMRCVPLPSLGAGTVMVACGDGSESSGGFAGTVYSSQAIFPFLPAEYAQLRVAGPLVSCVLGKTRAEFTMTVGATDRVALSDIADAVRVFRAVQSVGVREIAVQVRLPDVSFALRYGERRCGPLPSSITRLLEAAESARRIADAVGIPAAEEVEVWQLVRQAEQLGFVSSVFGGGVADGSFAATFKKHEIEELAEKSSRVAALSLHIVRLGAQCVVVACATEGSTEWCKLGEEELEGKVSGSVRRIRHWVVTSDGLERFRLDRAAKESSELLESQGVELVLMPELKE